MIDFIPFPKIARLRREVIVTEKIDGTNACIYVPESPAEPLVAGKRSGWIAPGPTDNHGFAVWVESHKEELRQLGPGVHFGEWWGSGINKRYPEVGKTFSLFNVGRWKGDGAGYGEKAVAPPACCLVVPVVARLSVFDTRGIEAALADLSLNGSRAAPGNMRPEGVVIFHAASRAMFKVTLEKDDEYKGATRDE